MPNVLRVGPYRFFFFSRETLEPRHIHVTSNNPPGSAKFWLDEVALAASYGYDGREVRAIQDLVEEHQEEFVRAWDEYFSRQN